VVLNVRCGDVCAGFGFDGWGVVLVMEYLQMFLMGVLSLCGVGVAALLVFVFVYIANDMIKTRNKQCRESNCKWDKNGDLDIYSTSCDHEFFDATESGNPPTDWLTYCPYCSGKVKVK